MDNSEEKKLLTAISQAIEKPFPQRKIAEKNLASFTKIHLIENLFKNENVLVRRSLIEILKYMKPSKKVSELLFTALQNDENVKNRRRAAAAIGESGDAKSQKRLIEAFEKEEHRFVKASIILALGATGFKWTEEWKEKIGEKGPLAEAFRKANARSKASIKYLQTKELKQNHVNYPPAKYLLKCYQGVEQFVSQELKIYGFKNARILTSGWIQIDLSDSTPEKLENLGKIRTIQSTFVIAKTNPDKIDDDIIDACKKIPTKTENENNTFRLSLPKMKSRSKYRKEVIRLSKIITKKTDFQNNPSAYLLDIQVQKIADKTYIIWRDTRWETAHKTNKRLTLPASIHPSVASVLCLAGEVKSDDIFCDPCCGAGTILSERLEFGKVKKVYGFDISAEAIRLSKENLSKFREKINLQIGDMKNLPLKDDSLNIVIANLPFGIRTGKRKNNRKLYRGFIKESLRVLQNKGRLIAYTNDSKHFEMACREFNWKNVKKLTTVKADGLKIFIYKAIKD